jgi:hypothetical protein
MTAEASSSPRAGVRVWLLMECGAMRVMQPVCPFEEEVGHVPAEFREFKRVADWKNRRSSGTAKMPPRLNLQSVYPLVK